MMLKNYKTGAKNGNHINMIKSECDSKEARGQK